MSFLYPVVHDRADQSKEASPLLLLGCFARCIQLMKQEAISNSSDYSLSCPPCHDGGGQWEHLASEFQRNKTKPREEMWGI